MFIRRAIRESAFHLARHDVAIFLEEHEDDLLQVFREEMKRLDDEIPEENLFIDIKMVPLGEVVMRAGLRAIVRFLRDDITRDDEVELPTSIKKLEHAMDAEEVGR